MKPVSRPLFIVSVTAAIIFWVHAFVDEDGFLILDYVNLPFHQLGHLLFGLFGETFSIWGGTIGQLVVPFALLIVFLARKKTLGVAFAIFWFGENLVNISNYIADAQVTLLPLVEGREYDWNTILSGLRMLQRSVLIGTVVRIAGWLVMIASVVWLVVVTFHRQPLKGSLSEKQDWCVALNQEV